MHTLVTVLWRIFLLTKDNLFKKITQKFVSSANELHKMKDGVYYPTGIRKLSEGGTFNLIQEGVDNIDINSKQ